MTYQNYTEEIKDNPYRNWHPTDINNALCDLADIPEERRLDVLNILYDLQCIANNKYNRDGYRAFYEALVELADRYERGDIEVTA